MHVWIIEIWNDTHWEPWDTYLTRETARNALPNLRGAGYYTRVRKYIPEFHIPQTGIWR